MMCALLDIVYYCVCSRFLTGAFFCLLVKPPFSLYCVCPCRANNTQLHHKKTFCKNTGYKISPFRVGIGFIQKKCNKLIYEYRQVPLKGGDLART
jgi:hypothetical protein